MLLLQQMIIFFFIILLGYYASVRKLWDNNAVNKVSNLIANLTGPCMILSAGINKDFGLTAMDLMGILLYATAAHAVLMALGSMVCLLPGIKADDRSIYKAMTVLSNLGFIGLPIAQAVYGDQTMLYLSIFLFPNNFVVYTYVIYEVSSSDRRAEVRRHIAEPKYLAHSLINAGTIACLLSILCVLTQIHVPYIFEKTISSVGGLTGTLAMMVVGHSLSQMDIASLVRSKALCAYSLLRMVVFPILLMMIIIRLPLSTELKQASLMFFTLPVGVMNSILAMEYGGNYLLASRGIALTTFVSVATMPLVSLIVGI
jgi:predicted permease